MPTWYSDYSSGSLNNSGDSFAVTLTGAALVATGTTTVTSVGGGFTGLSGRKIYIVGIGGRTISSVTNDTTIVLNASVTTGTYTFNIGGRRTTMDSFTTAFCQGFAAGDTVRMMASPTPTSLSVSGNFADCSPTVVLLGGSGTLVNNAESAWAGVTNVTVTQSTTAKVGTYSVSVAVASGFTTGKAAYFDLGSTIDYSSNQILTFWMQQAAGTNIVAGDMSIKLCSDAAGATPVSTFAVPALPIGGSAAGAQNVWVPVAIDLGSAISSTVRSIAVYINVDRAAQTFLFDDFKVWTSPALAKNIDMCESAWVGSTNVTSVTNTSCKQGSAAITLVVQAAFTTGLAAYKALGATVDFSGYRQVSFLIRQVSGTQMLASGGMSIRLCSDAVGATTVNSLPIPPLTGSANNQWHTITINYGAALGSAIQSIAIYVDTDAGSQGFDIDNIIACKDSTGDNAITLQSLFGKTNSTGAGGTDAETWYCIRSLTSTTNTPGQDCNTLTIETGPNSSAATASRGYYGTPEIGPVFRRETIKTPYVASSSAAVQSAQVAGTSGSPITWSGGWDRTAMTSQGGETWFDGGNGLGYGVATNTKNFQTLAKAGCVRCGIGIRINTDSDITVTDCHTNCNGSNGAGFGPRTSHTRLFACNNGAVGIGDDASAGATFNSLVSCVAHANVSGGVSVYGTATITSCKMAGNSLNGVNMGFTTKGYGGLLAGCDILRNATHGIAISASGSVIAECTISGNGSTGVAASNDRTSDVRIQRGSVVKSGDSIKSDTGYGITLSSDSTVIDVAPVSSLAFGDGVVRLCRYNNTDDDHRGYTDGGTWQSQAVTRHTASGIAWQMNPTSTNRSATYPLRMSLGSYAVPAGTTTIKVWLRRTNTGLTVTLNVPGYQLPGITTDVTASMTAAADTWEEVSLNVSPTSAGVIALEVLAYGGTTYTGYIDDLTVGGVAIPLNYAYQGQPAAGPVVAAGGGGGGGMLMHSSLIAG